MSVAGPVATPATYSPAELAALTPVTLPGIAGTQQSFTATGAP